MYYIRGVNPQYNNHVDKWLTEIGLCLEHRIILLKKLHQFRNQAVRRIISPKEFKNANSVQSSKSRVRGIK